MKRYNINDYNRKTDNFIMGAGLFWIVLWITVFIGWVINMFKVIQHASDPVTLIEILRVIGIFAFPFGSVLGWFF